MNTDEFSKCKTCKEYDIWEGCFGDSMDGTYQCYRPDKEKLIELAKKYEITVTDVINLINM